VNLDDVQISLFFCKPIAVGGAGGAFIFQAVPLRHGALRIASAYLHANRIN